MDADRRRDDGEREPETRHERLVEPIHQDVRPGLHLGQALDRAGEVVRAGGSRRHDVDRETLGTERRRDLEELAHRGAYLSLAGHPIWLARAMPLVAEQTPEADALELRGGAPDLARADHVTRAAAPHAHVDLDDDADGHARRVRACGELPKVPDIIDRGRHVTCPGDCDQMLDRGRAHDLVRDQDVRHTCIEHRLRLGDRRRRHPDRTVLQLEPRKFHGLVGLDVGRSAEGNCRISLPISAAFAVATAGSRMSAGVSNSSTASPIGSCDRRLRSATPTLRTRGRRG